VGLPYPSLEVSAPDIQVQVEPAGWVFGEGEHEHQPMPNFLAIPRDELHLGETTLQDRDQEIFILAHQHRYQSLVPDATRIRPREESPRR
jgi:hypothetical protein